MAAPTESVELVGEETTHNVARAAVFAAATSATAPVSVTHPLVPGVPVTLQTLWVYLSGVVLGPLWAGVAFVLYLVSGLVGLPVFAGGAAGLGVVLGPTGGFLVGFPIAAVVVGSVAHGPGDLRRPTEVPAPRLLLATVAGAAVVYAAGASGYALAQAVSLPVALAAVVVPFLPVAGVKVLAAVGVLRADALVVR